MPSIAVTWYRIGLLLLVCCACVATVARTNAEEQTSTRAIQLGQPLADTLATLHERKMKWHENGFQEVRLNQDIGDLRFEVDERRLVRVFYSKSAKKVTGISLTMQPADGATKLTRIDCHAKSIRLEDDGSYVIHFSPPAKKLDFQLR